MRDAAEEENEIGWWADVTTLSPKGMIEQSLDKRSRAMESAIRVLSAVVALQNLERVKEKKIRQRLEAVRSRIRKRIDEHCICAVGRLVLTGSEEMR